MARAVLRIGIDTGGTFTDVAVLERGRLRVHKLPSTPDDPGRAVLDGLAAVRGDREVDVVHGTTVGLNAVLTGRLAKTAFVTNDGFIDLVEIGRQDRSSVYDLEAGKPTFPVPRSLRFCVDSRRTSDGKRLAHPTRDALRTLRDALAKRRVESVAIGLLHSYAWPEDEREVARALATLGVPITCSAELLPASGEYERFSTAVINAAIAPNVGRYVASLATGARPGRLRLLRSSGGIMAAEEAQRFPARALFSGPAGGVAACAELARTLDEPRVATLDMGGTSTDVALVDRERDAAPAAATIAGLPLAAPSVDVHTIGCGGGSIAHADAGGALRVGPESAGAQPGPACYGVGDEPTVTDAHVVLGHLGAKTLLGGNFEIEPARSLHAVKRLGKRLGLTPLACARGILEVAETAMVRALLVMTVERRIDPARVPLVAFGGAGGLHAAGLVRRLSMRYAIVPDHPGAFSAVGLALAGESFEVSETVLCRLDDLPKKALRTRIDALAGRARSGIEAARARIGVQALLRFEGQGRGLWVDASADLGRRFQHAHELQFGFAPAERHIEIVELRGRASAAGPRLAQRHLSDKTQSPKETKTRRSLASSHTWPVHTRRDLAPGARVTGPALVDDTTGVIVVPAGFWLAVTHTGVRLNTGNRG